ncbi:MAG TPA: hypothetical protein VH482_08225 [Thermomicrobiales bacterium]|jgi:hypothetical protein
MVSENPRDRAIDGYPPPDPATTWPAQDVVVGTPDLATRSAPAYPRTGVAVAETVLPVRNRVQWGPVLAGIAATLTSMLVLTALGLAIGASAFKPGTDVTDWGTWAGIYGIASALVSFFFGGWIAARTAAVGGDFAGLVNGFVAGAASLLGLFWLSTTGLVNLVGFFGANVRNVTDVISGNESLTTAANNAGITYDDVKNGAWITFVVMVAVLAAAAIGGWLGHHDRADLEQGA